MDHEWNSQLLLGLRKRGDELHFDDASSVEFVKSAFGLMELNATNGTCFLAMYYRNLAEYVQQKLNASGNASSDMPVISKFFY